MVSITFTTMLEATYLLVTGLTYSQMMLKSCSEFSLVTLATWCYLLMNRGRKSCVFLIFLDKVLKFNLAISKSLCAWQSRKQIKHVWRTVWICVWEGNDLPPPTAPPTFFSESFLFLFLERNCGYSDLGIWKTNSHQRVKRGCYFRTNNWQYL